MYCTAKDVTNTHQLLNEQDFPDDEVNTFITDAQTLIDSVLSEQYVVPLQGQIPDIIRIICKYKAAALMLAVHFSGINYKEDTPLSVHYERLADKELNRVIEKDLLNDMPSVIRKQPNVRETRPQIASTTPRQSHAKRALREFDNATSIYDPWRMKP